MKKKSPLLASLKKLANTPVTTKKAAKRQTSETPETTETDASPPLAQMPSLGEQRTLSEVAESFSETAGSSALPIIRALRTGSEISYETEYEIPLEVPELDADGDPIYETNWDGTLAYDAKGMPIPVTHTVEIPVLDPDGSPICQIAPDGTAVLDSNGELVFETKLQTETLTKTVVVENPIGTLGIANIKLTMLLVEETFKRRNATPDIADIAATLFGGPHPTGHGILELRASGATWEQISQQLLGAKICALMETKRKPNGSPLFGRSEIDSVRHEAKSPLDQTRAVQRMAV